MLISDYDLSVASSLEQLRAVLDDIKSSAEAEELTTFDPSGSNAKRDTSTTDASPERARSWHGDALSEDTDLTNLSQSLGSWSIHGKNEGEVRESQVHETSWDDTRTEKLPVIDHTAVLQAMFPTITAFNIEYALKKSGGRFGPTVEDLLNQAFFEEERLTSGTPTIQKGIDGFAESMQGRQARGRRARGKRKKQPRRTSSTPAPESATSTVDASSQSRWDRGKEEIEFIAQRVHISRQTVASTYHKSGASMPSTIGALCSLQESAISNPYLLSAPRPIVDASVKSLSHDFPYVSQKTLEGLVWLTYPAMASANELAHALTNATHGSSFTTQIMPQYSPRPSTPPSPTSRNVDSSSPLPTKVAANLTAVRSTAFAQASAAYRKSKSKPLMAGAASYYSSVGRDAAAGMARHEAAVSDALVSEQSRNGEIDLHGVNVKNALRIAKNKVQSWWDGGAAEWARKGKVQEGDGLRIVTGIGRHSEGGRSKIGPAVGAMLVREGWKVEIGEGVILVRGRVRS